MGDMAPVNGFTPEQIHDARIWAKRYELRGYTPLPSRSDAKRPLMAYGEWWDGGAPSVDELWDRYPSGNIQLIAGRNAGKRGLCVVDLDGAEGIEAFKAEIRRRGATLPRTWVSSSLASDGLHLWFTLPYRLRNGAPIPTRRLWGIWEPEAREGRGDWKHRANIELLCDRRLVMAPPSIHPKHPERSYNWHKGSSPFDMPNPAPLPDWVRAMNADLLKPVRPKVPLVKHKYPSPSKPGGLPARPSDILEMLPKMAVINDYGIRVWSTRENGKGWIRVHDFDREDANPSAAFHPGTGLFWRPNGFPPKFDNKPISLFRLGVEMGIYPDWYTACYVLARQYLPHLFKDKAKNNVG